MGILIRLIILVFVILPSSALGVCTYTSGSISCPVEMNSDDCAGSASACGEASGGWVINSTDTARYYTRFKVSVPKNATVTNAHVKIHAAYTQNNSGTGYVALLDSDNQSALSASTSATWNLGISGSEVSYDPAAWTADQEYNIPADANGIKDLVASWIGRAGYQYGYYMGLRFRTNAAGAYAILQAYSGNATSTWPVLNITFTGGDPIMTVYANYPHNYITQRIRLNLYNTVNTQKLKITLDDSPVAGFPKTMTSGFTSPEDEWVEVDYSALTAGSHTLRLVVTDASDVEYASTVRTITFTTTHDSATPNVGFDKYNNFVLGNVDTKFFLITPFQTSSSQLGNPPLYKLFNAINATNCSRLVTPNTEDNVTNWKAYLDLNAARGLMHVGPVMGTYWTNNLKGHVLIKQSFTETFEASGTDIGTCADSSDTDCWTETGTVDDDFTSAPLVGSQSVQVDGSVSGSNIAYTLQEDALRLRFKVALKETSTHAAQDIINLKDDEGTVVGKVTWNADTTMTLTHGTTTMATTKTYAANTTHYLWIDWTTAQSTGIWGGFILYSNTSDNKATATRDAVIPESESTLTPGQDTGSGTGMIHTVELAANGAVILYDSYADWIDALEDYADGVKSAYPALFAYSWVDEPDTNPSAEASKIKSWNDATKLRDTSRPTQVQFGGHQFCDDLYTVKGYSEYPNTLGPGTNAGSFSGVPTPITDLVVFDFYPYEYWTTYTNIDVANILSGMDNLFTITGQVQPFYIAIEIDDIHDNYATSYLEVSGITGSFAKGDTITATSGGTCVIPTTTGPTINTYVRSTTDPQLILCNSKTGTFGASDTLTATSGGTATYSKVSTVRPGGSAKVVEWTPGPTDDQWKNLAWLSIIHGAKGMTYFDYGMSYDNKLSASRISLLETYKTDVTSVWINYIAGAPATTFANDSGSNHAKSTNAGAVTVTGSGRVDAMARTYGGMTAVFAARVPLTSEGWPNTNGGTETARFNITGLTAGTNITRYFAGTSFQAQGNGYFTDTFPDYKTEIYLLNSTTPEYTVTVTKAGAGSGLITSSPSGISCGSTCSLDFTAGTTVILTATPSGDNVFDGWSTTSGKVCGCTGTSTCTLSTIDADKDCTATFSQPVPPSQYLVIITYAGTGAGVTDPAQGSTSKAQGATVTITQTPTSPSTFTSWSGTCGCTGAGSCEFSMPGNDCTVIATWADVTRYTLTVSYTVEKGKVTSTDNYISCGYGESKDCIYNYANGTEITLAGVCYDGWYNPTLSGDCSGSSCNLTMSAAKTISLTCTNGRAANIGSGGSVTLGGSGTISVE